MSVQTHTHTRTKSLVLATMLLWLNSFCARVTISGSWCVRISPSTYLWCVQRWVDVIIYLLSHFVHLAVSPIGCRCALCVRILINFKHSIASIQYADCSEYGQKCRRQYMARQICTEIEMIYCLRFALTFEKELQASSRLDLSSILDTCNYDSISLALTYLAGMRGTRKMIETDIIDVRFENILLCDSINTVFRCSSQGSVFIFVCLPEFFFLRFVRWTGSCQLI